jgi:hypothetical protein
MKTLFLAALALACTLTLKANDILANGNFVDGTAHWHGDAHASTDWDNQGIVIQLSPSKWTKISQTFNTKETVLDFSITYKTSPDCSFSDAAKGTTLSVDDLISLTEIRFKDPIHLKLGSWFLMINDPSSNPPQGTYFTIQPKLKLADAQTVTGSVPKLAAHEEKTVFLAFPPGQGTITLLHVALTPTGAASTPASPFPTP